MQISVDIQQGRRNVLEYWFNTVVGLCKRGAGEVMKSLIEAIKYSYI
jgi:hypothetical protein